MAKIFWRELRDKIPSAAACLILYIISAGYLELLGLHSHKEIAYLNDGAQMRPGLLVLPRQL